jgi:hypothetical protein
VTSGSVGLPETVAAELDRENITGSTSNRSGCPALPLGEMSAAAEICSTVVLW